MVDGGESYSEGRVHRLTPMMRQWRQFKRLHSSHLLLFRMGDFYELFYDDARVASSVLSLTLTSRLSIPMCGFPHFSLSTHLRRLLAAGHSVAVCDQVESVSARKERKSTVVQREISRIVTPGTLLDDFTLHPKQFNFLLALHTQRRKGKAAVQGGEEEEEEEEGDGQLGEVGICWVDVSTGVFAHQSLPSLSSLSQELARLCPAEVLVAESLSSHRRLRSLLQGFATTVRPDSAFLPDLSAHLECWQQRTNESRRRRELLSAEEVGEDEDEPAKEAASAPLRAAAASQSGSPSSSAPPLSGEASMRELHPADLVLSCSPVELSACGGVLDYLLYTQRTSVPRLFAPSASSLAPSMSIDAATRRSLELTQSLSRGSRLGSLLHTMDETVTSGGGRLLSSYLASPLTDVRTINHRLAVVEWFVQDRLCCEAVRARLKECEDIQRGLQRIGMRKTGGGAREMRAIVSTVHKGRDIARLIGDAIDASRGEGESSPSQAVLAPLLTLLSHPSLASLASKLDGAIVDEPPLLLESGHFIRQSYHPPLSTLSSLSSTTAQRITALQHSLRSALSLPVRIKRNTGVGYYIEVSASRGRELEERRRAGGGGELLQGLSLFQQLKAEWRYKSADLIGLQQEMTNAGEEMLALEMRLYEQLREEVMDHVALLNSLAQALSTVDVYTGLAHLAVDQSYVRPRLIEPAPDGDEEVFEVVAGRHPVVESRLHALYRERERERRRATAEEGETTPPLALNGSSLDAEHPPPSLSLSFSAVYASSTPYVDFTPNDCSLRTSACRLCLLTGPQHEREVLRSRHPPPPLRRRHHRRGGTSSVVSG